MVDRRRVPDLGRNVGLVGRVVGRTPGERDLDFVGLERTGLGGDGLLTDDFRMAGALPDVALAAVDVVAGEIPAVADLQRRTDAGAVAGLIRPLARVLHIPRS